MTKKMECTAYPVCLEDIDRSPTLLPCGYPFCITHATKDCKRCPVCSRMIRPDDSPEPSHALVDMITVISSINNAGIRVTATAARIPSRLRRSRVSVGKEYDCGSGPFN
jgi:hypothetical protein